MQHDLIDFLRPSPYPVIEYYLRKAELAPVPSDSHILNDPGVRIYASIITRICLCFKYWDADWRDTVPVSRSRGEGESPHSTHHTFLTAPFPAYPAPSCSSFLDTCTVTGLHLHPA